MLKNKESRLKSSLIKLDSNVWNIGLQVPTELAKALKNAGVNRVKCSFKNGHIHHTKIQFLKANGYFINVNATLRKELNAQVGDVLEVQLEADDNPYGMPVPEVFVELLKQDADGSAYFHALTPGKQRNLIYLVAQVKSEEIQLRRGMVILSYLKSTSGLLDFKALNAAIKHANRQA